MTRRRRNSTRSRKRRLKKLVEAEKKAARADKLADQWRAERTAKPPAPPEPNVIEQAFLSSELACGVGLVIFLVGAGVAAYLHYATALVVPFWVPWVLCVILGWSFGVLHIGMPWVGER